MNKTKVLHKKVWKPKDLKIKETENVTLKDPLPGDDIGPLPNCVVKTFSLSESDKMCSDKEVNAIQLESFVTAPGADVFPDSSLQIVPYQKIEAKWGVLDERAGLEEGEIVTEIVPHGEEGVSRPKDLLAIEPVVGLVDKDGFSKAKSASRKKTDKKNNSKGVETRSSSKVNPKSLTPVKPGKKIDQKAKVKPDVGTPDGRGRKTSMKTRELESLQNIADGCQATILDYNPKLWK